MRHYLLTLAAMVMAGTAQAQKTYADSMAAFRQVYVTKHEVVKGADRKALRFFPVSKAHRVLARFEPATATRWLSFRTSGNGNRLYRVYGTLRFRLNGKDCTLSLYQSQDLLSNPAYADYLFLPFTDSTSGRQTYPGGRYLDLRTGEIRNGWVLVDFNKAYNPYCAYVSGVYDCPIPPAENTLPVAVRAGEKLFAKPH